MAIQVFHIVRPPMPFHITTARIYGPSRISDFAGDKGFVRGVAEADRDIGLSF